MNKQKTTKINQLLNKIPNNTIFTSRWAKENSFSEELLYAYKKSKWIKSVGTGAYTKLNDEYNMDGAIYALQKQLNLSVHIGGVSALNEKHGLVHNIPFNRKIYLYTQRQELLPKWFKTLFKDKYILIHTNFLPKDIGMENNSNISYTTQISTKERAILEMLYLVPNKNTANEAYQLMELLSILKIDLIQKLLEGTKSIKVKRLFLYMAEKINYPWFKKINIKKIYLGSGKKVIVKGGKLDKKYNIVIDDVENI